MKRGIGNGMLLRLPANKRACASMNISNTTRLGSGLSRLDFHGGLDVYVLVFLFLGTS